MCIQAPSYCVITVPTLLSSSRLLLQLRSRGTLGQFLSLFIIFFYATEIALYMCHLFFAHQCSCYDYVQRIHNVCFLSLLLFLCSLHSSETALHMCQLFFPHHGCYYDYVQRKGYIDTLGHLFNHCCTINSFTLPCIRANYSITLPLQTSIGCLSFPSLSLFPHERKKKVQSLINFSSFILR